MSNTKIAFQDKKIEFLYNFLGEESTSDGGLLLLNQYLKKSDIVNFFSRRIKDNRHSSYTKFEYSELLKLRLLLISCGYEDCNDINHLKNDPALKALFKNLPSQSTLSRFENSMNIGMVYRLAQSMIDFYVDSIETNRKEIIIDVDCTDDPTHGNQQGSLFDGYHWQYQYNELFYLDGQTGQIIFPVLRPGSVHSSKWNHIFLKIIISKIRKKHPHINIIVRADAGFSSPDFYSCVSELNIEYCIGIASNSRIKSLFEQEIQLIQKAFVNQQTKHQHFCGPKLYKAQSWNQYQWIYAKIESTGKGLNVRYIVSNQNDLSSSQLYKAFYVLRGETAENRIKEIKNFCFSDRLSCSRFSANYFRLIISCLAYELLRSIKQRLNQLSNNPTIKNWNIQSVRLYLIKIAAQIKINIRRVYFKFARGHPYHSILDKLLQT